MIIKGQAEVKVKVKKPVSLMPTCGRYGIGHGCIKSFEEIIVCCCRGEYRSPFVEAGKSSFHLQASCFDTRLLADERLLVKSFERNPLTVNDTGLVALALT
jgi:hypothetical protein